MEMRMAHHHLVSMLMFIASRTLLICQNVVAPNPYNYPAFYPYFQPVWTQLSVNSHEQFSAPYDQQLILGSHTIPPTGLFFPSESTDLGGISPLVHLFNTDKQRIVGGFPVSEGVVPFMTAYQIPKVAGNPSQCGGTLITPKHILTAAHCLDSKDSRPIGGPIIINTVSTADLSETSEERKVKAFKIHELYKVIDLPNDAGQVANGYDIAILTLDEAVTTVKPVKLANVDQTPAIVESFKNAFATGWGRTDPLTASSSEVLIGTVLKIVSNADYQKIKDKTLPDIKGTQMSAYYPFGGRGTCRGDSGGPLMVGNQKDGFLQVGITSYGDALSCGLYSDKPGVFTRVSRFFDWININTGGLLE